LLSGLGTSDRAPADLMGERVPPPGSDATLLAIVPIPGTSTSLAIVAYAISTAETSEPGPGRKPAEPHPAEPATAEQHDNARLLLDHANRQVWAGGKPVELTHQEFELLAFFSAHPGTLFTRAEIVEQAWRPGKTTIAPSSRTVDVHVSRLRRKLGPVYGHCLVTEHRAGYRFRPNTPNTPNT
jgi:DNA-binding response OmpR family regulator